MIKYTQVAAIINYHTLAEKINHMHTKVPLKVTWYENVSHHLHGHQTLTKKFLKKNSLHFFIYIFVSTI